MADTPGAPRTPEPSLSDTDSLAPDDHNLHVDMPPGASAAGAAPRDKGKDRAKAPLRLLDLPVDILKEIIQQLPHTNDLTSLSLTHSALHRLTVPCIYSRFDIVWPDESTHTEPRSGVDALTYGLATLVMGEEGFPHQNRQNSTYTGGHANRKMANGGASAYPVPRRRFGNYYAQFTKKFSLGNGPAAWVQEYMITKEGGKMLGTLVALAIARMVNLETFVWDMPTGVLRDVWLALSSLAHRTDGEDCRLDNLWIRWHDNSIDAPVPPPAPPMILNNVNVPPPPNAGHPSAVAGQVQPAIVVPQHFNHQVQPAIERVEHPTFSVIPPLKSLSVLDIDELPYLDEMSILIARSQKKLRELRVGIAPQAQQRDWVTAWEGDGIQQVDYEASWTGASAIGEKRLGGVLGILVGRVHNLRHSEEKPAPAKSAATSSRMFGLPVKFGLAGAVPVPSTAAPDREPDNTTDHFGNPLDEPAVPEGVSLIDEMHSLTIDTPTSPFDSQDSRTSAALTPPADEPDASPDASQAPTQERLTGQLKLEVLELERVPLSVSVLLKAFDWTMLTTLTLLNCTNHEQLWKSLRRTYTPRPAYPNGSPSSSKAYRASYTLRTEYTLNLRKIHTNTVSPSLISFLKETLAPNSLEVLFLQEGRSYQSSVTVDAIYRGPLRRHRASLKKLMIDSSEKQDGLATGSSRWRRWMLNRDILSFVTSGRMGALRELAVAIEYRDWHHLLQRLPLIPHIRSLYIPHLADHPHGSNMDPRELAYQIVDIVHLRPEIELCYMGLAAKCFEILENRPRDYDLRGGEVEGVLGGHGHGAGNGAGGGGGHGGGNGMGAAGNGIGNGNPNAPPYPDAMPSSDDDDDSEGTEDDDELDDEDGGGGASHLAGAMGASAEEDETDEEEGFSESEDEGGEVGPKLRVREILFYEERVEAFRRRHGVLRP